MDVENLNDHTQSSEISSSSSSSDTDPNSPYPVENLQKLDQSTDQTAELQSLDVASTQTVQDQVGVGRASSPIPDRGNSPTPDRGKSPTPDRGKSPTPDGGKSPTPDIKKPLTPGSISAEGCESSPHYSSKDTASAPSESNTPCVEEPKEPYPEVEAESNESLSQDAMVQGQAEAYFGRKSVTSEHVVKYFAMPSVNNMKVTLGLGGAINLGCSPILPKKGNTYERDYSCENHSTSPSENSDDEDVEIAEDMEEADWSFDEEDDGAKPGKQCPCSFKSPAGSESSNKTPLQRQNTNLDAPGTSSPFHTNPFYTVSSPVLHCPDCEQTFNCLVDLNRHRLKHIKEKTFKCTHCDKSFAFSFNLKSHERQHTGEKPYVCNKCGLSFIHAFDFHEHQRVHDGRGHFVCSICLKWFSHESKFLLHTRKHSSIKPFKCNMCGKSFHRAAGLRAHELLHSVQKEDQQLFPCQFCDRTFVRMSHKQMHERIHSEEKVFPCLHCGKTFTDLTTLKGHACMQGNGNQFKCNICTEEFLSLPLLASHSKVHVTQKASTSRNAQVPSTKFNTFKRKGPLADAKRRFPCKLCSRVFSNKRLLEDHGKIHQRERTPYMCNECCMTFTHANYLKLHMTMHTNQDSTQCEGQSAENAQMNGKPSPLVIIPGSSSPLSVCRSRQSSGEQSASPSPVSKCPPIQIKAEPQ